ncbi:MAG: hypothetical protein IIB17_12230, partial [Chloroflexi bacterium]|nr:hypothetical protein [Chloroflexota bacterium]
MATTAEPKQDSPRKFRILDTSPIRHDGLDKVTGRAQFGADFHMQGTLYGKILRSPHAHARILSIDTSKAEALPGVKAVVTASDFPIISQPLDLSQARATPRAVAENVIGSMIEQAVGDRAGQKSDAVGRDFHDRRALSVEPHIEALAQGEVAVRAGDLGLDERASVDATRDGSILGVYHGGRGDGARHDHARQH